MSSDDDEQVVPIVNHHSAPCTPRRRRRRSGGLKANFPIVNVAVQPKRSMGAKKQRRFDNCMLVFLEKLSCSSIKQKHLFKSKGFETVVTVIGQIWNEHSTSTVRIQSTTY